MRKELKDSWKEYMEILMNEENEWDYGISAEVKEGPAGCIRIGEAVGALKKMKRHKAPGLSGLSAEMIQATKGIGTQWLLWSPYVIGQTIIFLPCGFYLLLLLFFSSPNLSGHRLDVYHTSTHGVALVRI